MSKDKKQLLVVGILGLAMLAIGAFQFLAPKGPVAVAPEPEAAESNTSTDEVAVNDPPPVTKPEDIITGLLGKVEPRDPFLAQAIIVKPPDPDDQQTTGGQRPPRPPVEITGSGGTEPWPPDMTGGLTEGPALGEFAYKLKGVLVGANKNIAVFEDSNGNQRLVGVGATFGSDSETEVISIDANGVTIRHRDKIKTLRVE
ncbi:MAG: hypothetical protein IH944_13925 [Armatimonadetes bacterium]|nr:hypothetical protein [Armatimonadota bacterium]